MTQTWETEWMTWVGNYVIKFILIVCLCSTMHACLFLFCWGVYLGIGCVTEREGCVCAGGWGEWGGGYAVFSNVTYKSVVIKSLFPIRLVPIEMEGEMKDHYRLCFNWDKAPCCYFPPSSILSSHSFFFVSPWHRLTWKICRKINLSESL